MKQEDKGLLFKDLCARLPYGFTIHRYSDNCDIVIESNGIDDFAHFLEYSEGEDFKPYLRPMSSMTEEEANEWAKASKMKFDMEDGFLYAYDAYFSVDLLNAHHFDYRGLIEKGLALEAPEGMYNIK